LADTLGERARSAEAPARTDAALELEGLTKSYAIGRLGRRQLVRVLAGIDLSVAKGEVLGVVGESGSGKTTLARVVSYLERPSGGTIKVGGRTLARRPSQRELRRHRSQVQMIFQDPYTSLDPLRSIAATLASPLRSFSGLSPAARAKRREELLEMVGLVPPREFLGRYPYQLSGGQRQRVGIARALAADPMLILADEPTSMLDVSIRLNIMNLLLDLQRERGLSLVFITHDLAGAHYMSDRIAIMYAGHLLEVGPAEAVMATPAHPYTQLLREAAPDPASGFARGRRLKVKGEPPDLTRPPSGCPFGPRCRFVTSVCQAELPQWRDLGGGHRVRCVLYEPNGAKS